MTDVADVFEIKARDGVAVVIGQGALWIDTFMEARDAIFTEIDVVLRVEQEPEEEVSDKASKVLTEDLAGVER